jgi:hypothetical protein
VLELSSSKGVGLHGVGTLGEGHVLHVWENPEVVVLLAYGAVAGIHVFQLWELDGVLDCTTVAVALVFFEVWGGSSGSHDCDSGIK